MFRVRRPKLFLKTGTFKFCVIIFAVFIVLYGFFSFIERRLTPNIMTIAETQAKVLATEAINKAVKEEVAKKVKYKDLISIHKDTNGQTTLIQVNTGEINRLETETALETVKVLKEATMAGVTVPLGAATGNKLLSNYGPKIHLSLFPGGTADVNAVEIFEDAGINQTRHKIAFEIVADIKIIQPLLSTYITVKTSVPLVETIIIGNVPHAIIGFK